MDVPATRLGMRGRACLALGATCRRIFHFRLPEDLADPGFDDAYFEDHVSRGRRFLSNFAERPDLEGKVVLDLGCGYGGLMDVLAESGADRVLGVDVEAARVSFAQQRLKGNPKASAALGDAAALPLPDASVDVVVSDSALEHIHDLPAAVAEISRVLRPGGRVYALWGNSWLTFNGPHLIKCIGVPWVHLLFSDRTIMEVLNHLKEHGPYPPSYIEYKIEDFQAMGRNTRRKLRRAAAQSALRFVQDESRSPRRWKSMLSRLPLLEELLAGDLIEILERPA
jgi:ubiquinone/menaquinone biosynthesis C-methylase UbiE